MSFDAGSGCQASLARAIFFLDLVVSGMGVEVAGRVEDGKAVADVGKVEL